MIINTDAVMILAIMIAVTCLLAYVALFIWGRREGRESDREIAKLHRQLEELLDR